MTRRLPSTWTFDDADDFRDYVQMRPLVRRALWRAAAVIEREMRDLSRDEITPHTVRVRTFADGLTLYVRATPGFTQHAATVMNERIERAMDDVPHAQRAPQVEIAVQWT